MFPLKTHFMYLQLTEERPTYFSSRWSLTASSPYQAAHGNLVFQVALLQVRAACHHRVQESLP